MTVLGTILHASATESWQAGPPLEQSSRGLPGPLRAEDLFTMVKSGLSPAGVDQSACDYPFVKGS